MTRNLLKRQVRSVFADHQTRLADGLWLVRLRQGFAASEFPAAASEPLRATVRRELEGLLTRPICGASARRSESRGSAPAAEAAG